MCKKKILICALCSSILFLLSGCGSDVSLFSIVFGGGGNEIVGTMTLAEYDLRVNRLLTVVFNDAETHLSNSKYVVSGNRSFDEEYSLTQTTINNVQSVIDEIDGLAEPKNRTTEKASLMIALTNYKNSLMTYAIALQSNNTEEVTNASSEIMVSLETLQGEWSSYTE